MLDKQKNVFLSGEGVSGLTEDALVVFLVDLLQSQGKKRFLFLSPPHVCSPNFNANLVAFLNTLSLSNAFIVYRIQQSPDLSFPWYGRLNTNDLLGKM